MTSSTTTRLAWPDVAKGISILGVVLLHVTLAVPEAQNAWLAHFNVWLDPLRLPLFFLVSGYFSTKVLRFSFVELFTRRLWFFLVPYCIWAGIELWLKKIEYHWVFDTPLLQKEDLFHALFFGSTMAWFLHALIAFNIFLWAVRKLPAWLAIALSFLPMLFMAWNAQFSFISKAVMFLPIFIGAAYLKDFITKYAQALAVPFHSRLNALSLWAYGGTFVAYATGFILRRAWDKQGDEVLFPWLLPGADMLGHDDLNVLIRFAEQLLEVPLGVLLAVVISHLGGLSQALQFVGRHTLPIYLGHPIGMTLGVGFYLAWNPRAISLAGDWPMDNTWFWLTACMVCSGLAGLVLWLIGKTPVLKWSLTPPPLAGRYRQFREWTSQKSSKPQPAQSERR
ncbi:acyltransferase family protein [Corynebacterium flavescens]|uniref:acyltransferase family protein n=1 Tax=Corynebacterium flavescens TaxID=28028 RepID=UPI00095163FB|nr:acyltransferase family protein [Corynebacterium flavescens]MDN6475466.1 acyltransferase family protein [Corynebacterium flavescens]MDN6551866.1 acyltransferase family protein [Corynebacterium flavescens]MDN6645283.1 acyltransferase family protein [Corynebacterium flavescens]MDN6687367.1 acyltransferase family protein [Corynebacterium flavescens]